MPYGLTRNTVALIQLGIVTVAKALWRGYRGRAPWEWGGDYRSQDY